MYSFQYPAAFLCCPALCRVFLVPCIFKYPGIYWADPPGYEGYYEPEMVEFNPPQVTYEEQEVPKEIMPQKDQELEHGYEYDVTG